MISYTTILVGGILFLLTEIIVACWFHSELKKTAVLKLLNLLFVVVSAATFFIPYSAQAGKTTAVCYGFPFLVFAIGNGGRGYLGPVSLISFVGDMTIWIIFFRLTAKFLRQRNAAVWHRGNRSL